MVDSSLSPEKQEGVHGSMFSHPRAERITAGFIDSLRSIHHDPTLTEEQRREGAADAFWKFKEEKEAADCTDLHFDTAWDLYTDDDGNIVL